MSSFQKKAAERTLARKKRLGMAPTKNDFAKVRYENNLFAKEVSKAGGADKFVERGDARRKKAESDNIRSFLSEKVDRAWSSLDTKGKKSYLNRVGGYSDWEKFKLRMSRRFSDKRKTYASALLEVLCFLGLMRKRVIATFDKGTVKVATLFNRAWNIKDGRRIYRLSSISEYNWR